MTKRDLKTIWEKTEGHCHFCGDPVVFERRGWRDGDLSGYWEVDHVIQRDKGGNGGALNCLAACTRCNRLRWHRKGEAMRELISLGLIARDEIQKKTSLGIALSALREKRLARNQSRRKTKSIVELQGPRPNRPFLEL